MARTRLVAGNWKMHGSRESNRALLDRLLQEIPGMKGVECAVCVPFPYLGQVAERLAGTAIAWGAQNVSEHAQGAYTGEVSAAMLAEFGCRYVIVGHSERRQLYGESDAQVAAKFAAAQGAGLVPILCVGETLAERDAGCTEQVVDRQLQQVLNLKGKDSVSKAVVAYEPVWAIGTGKTATSDQAQEVHAHLRETLTALVGREAAEQVRIQYGGSVNAETAPRLFAEPELDGALVGGASLEAASFFRIVAAAAAAV